MRINITNLRGEEQRQSAVRHPREAVNLGELKIKPGQADHDPPMNEQNRNHGSPEPKFPS